VAEDKEREKTGEDAVAFVVEQMKSGADEDAIVAMLQERGVERAEAQQLVGTVYPELMRVAEAEQSRPKRFCRQLPEASWPRSSAGPSGASS
jgi:hypothetical protein